MKKLNLLILIFCISHFSILLIAGTVITKTAKTKEKLFPKNYPEKTDINFELINNSKKTIYIFLEQAGREDFAKLEKGHAFQVNKDQYFNDMPKNLILYENGKIVAKYIIPRPGDKMTTYLEYNKKGELLPTYSMIFNSTPTGLSLKKNISEKPYQASLLKEQKKEYESKIQKLIQKLK